MKPNTFVEYLFYFLLLVFLFWIRIVGLKENLFYDYDSVKNYLILQEMYQGDFSEMFHHLSPGFYLFFLPFYAILQSTLGLLYLNCALDVLFIVFFVRFFYKNLGEELGFWDEWMMTLLLGTSFFMLGVGSFFSIENMGVILVCLLIFLYYRSTLVENTILSGLYLPAFLTGMILTVYYKILLLFPFIFLYELLYVKRKFSLVSLLRLCLFFSIFPLMMVMIGLCFQVPLKTYPAHLYAIFFNFGKKPPVEPDPLYYFYYLLNYENALVLPVFLLSIFWMIFNRLKDNVHLVLSAPWLRFIAFLLIYDLLLMSLLPKAPRGLSVIYPFLYAWVFVAFKAWTGNLAKLRYGLLLLSVALEVYNFKINQVDFSESGYPALTTYLKESGIRKILLTAGMQSIPFLQKDSIEYKVIRSEEEIPKYLEEGYHYILMDDFYQLVEMRNFGKTELLPIAWEAANPVMLNTMLHLENSEFTGEGFQTTLRKRDLMLKMPFLLSVRKIR